MGSSMTNQQLMKSNQWLKRQLAEAERESQRLQDLNDDLQSVIVQKSEELGKLRRAAARGPFRPRLCLVIICVIWALLMLAVRAEEMDPSKDVYQLNGRKWYKLGARSYVKVSIPEPKTVKALKEELKRQDMRHAQEMKEKMREQKQKEHTWGSWCKRIGWAILALGFAGHFFSAYPVVKSAASSVMTLGVCSIIAGLGVQKTVEHETIIVLVASVCIGGVVLYRWRNWSLSHVFKNQKRSL